MAEVDLNWTICKILTCFNQRSSMKQEGTLTITEAAELGRVTRQAVYQQITSKKIHATKWAGIWLIELKDFHAYQKSKYCRDKSKRTDGSLKFDHQKGQYSVSQLSKMFSQDLNRIYYLLRTNHLKYERVGSSYVVLIEDLEKTKQIVKGESRL